MIALWVLAAMPCGCVLTYGESANGFTRPARGWNAWALIANQKLNQTQDSVLQQCQKLAMHQVQRVTDAQYCSLDSGWSIACSGDEYGRPTADPVKFADIRSLAAQLRAHGVGLGVYIIPGSFEQDGDKKILGTNITLRSTWSNITGKFCRKAFDFSRPGVKEWHKSVVDYLCEIGVTYIKLDFVCPTMSPDGCKGFPDSRLSVSMYHAAIQQSQCAGNLRLDVSWMLDWKRQYFQDWSHTADSMRLDEDINNARHDKLVQFGTVQRAIERYRVFVTSYAKGYVNGIQDIHIRPDMDSTFLANSFGLSGLRDIQRKTMAMHWVGAGANLLEGGDLLLIDKLGEQLLHDPTIYGAGGILDQFSAHPMQPCNPRPPPSGTCPPYWPWSESSTNPQQLQAWIAGPNTAGNALVLLSNLGPDEEPRVAKNKFGTYHTKCRGRQRVQVTYRELGLALNVSYKAVIIWDGGNISRDNVTLASTKLVVDLDAWESIMFKVIPRSDSAHNA